MSRGQQALTAGQVQHAKGQVHDDTRWRQHRQHRPTQGQASCQKQLHVFEVSSHRWKACKVADTAASRAEAWPVAWARGHAAACLADRWQGALRRPCSHGRKCLTCHNDRLDQQAGLQVELVDPLQHALPPGVQEGTQHAVNPDISVEGRPEVPLCTPDRHQLYRVITSGSRGELSLQSCCITECLCCCVAALDQGHKHADLLQPRVIVQADSRSKWKPDRHHERVGRAHAAAHHAAHRRSASWGRHSPCTT